MYRQDTCVTLLFIVCLLFLPHKGKDLVSVLFTQQTFVEHLLCARWALETWVCCSLSSAQQRAGFRRAGESFQQMDGTGLSHPRIAHIHGQWHCVENEVSFQGRERLHTVGADAPLTEGGSQRLAWDPLVKSFTLPQHSHGGFIHAVLCPRPP